MATAFAWQGHAQPGPGQQAAASGPTTYAGLDAARRLPDGELAAALVKAGVMLRTLTPARKPELKPKPAPGKSIKAIKPIKHAAKPVRTPQPEPTTPPPPPPVYLNPLRAIAGLLSERIDMGADFGGTGPIYAIGDAVITNATGSSPGWPGGGWITYQLTDGPAAGLEVYVAEDVTPTVQVGEHVSSSTVIAQMYNGGAGIETGWAMPDGSSAESQLPVAGGVSGGGPFPTAVGVNFDNLLIALGVPPANNAGQAAYGLLPPNYPTTWAAATAPS